MTELRARRSRLARAAAHLGKAGEHAQVLDAGEHAHGCLLRAQTGRSSQSCASGFVSGWLRRSARTERAPAPPCHCRGPCCRVRAPAQSAGRGEHGRAAEYGREWRRPARCARAFSPMLTAAPRVATGRLASGAVKANSVATAASIWLKGICLGFAGKKINNCTGGAVRPPIPPLCVFFLSAARPPNATKKQRARFPRSLSFVSPRTTLQRSTLRPPPLRSPSRCFASAPAYHDSLVAPTTPRTSLPRSVSPHRRPGTLSPAGPATRAPTLPSRTQWHRNASRARCKPLLLSTSQSSVRFFSSAGEAGTGALC